MKHLRPSRVVQRSRALWSIAFFYAIFTLLIEWAGEAKWYNYFGLFLVVVIAIVKDREP